jgi:hypothetical protein
MNRQVEPLALRALVEMDSPRSARLSTSAARRFKGRTQVQTAQAAL